MRLQAVLTFRSSKTPGDPGQLLLQIPVVRPLRWTEPRCALCKPTLPIHTYRFRSNVFITKFGPTTRANPVRIGVAIRSPRRFLLPESADTTSKFFVFAGTSHNCSLLDGAHEVSPVQLRFEIRRWFTCLVHEPNAVCKFVVNYRCPISHAGNADGSRRRVVEEVRCFFDIFLRIIQIWKIRSMFLKMLKCGLRARPCQQLL